MTASRDDLLPPGTRWRSLEHRDVVDSTNRIVADAAAQGAAPGLVVTADHQTAGRGRRGRAWRDRPGHSLLVSALAVAPEVAATLVPLAAGLAVVDAIGDADASAGLKWPNDVVVGDPGPDSGAVAGGGAAKLAGILVESTDSVSGQRRMIIGVGINVDWRDVDHEAAVTSVAGEADTDVDRFALLTRVLSELDSRLDQLEHTPDQLLADYRAACVTLGRDVDVDTVTGRVSGRAHDVDDRGALIIHPNRNGRSRDGCGHLDLCGVVGGNADDMSWVRQRRPSAATVSDGGRETVVVDAGDVTHVRPAG